jgi:lysophospholipase L1-like esterase
MVSCSAGAGDESPPDDDAATANGAGGAATIGAGGATVIVGVAGTNAHQGGGGAAGSAASGAGGATAGAAGRGGGGGSAGPDAGSTDSGRSDSGFAGGGFDGGIFASLNCDVQTHPSTAVQVACVGDSITWGYGASDQATTSYPAQLGGMLGAGYGVHNFGVNGTDMLKHGDNPYWNQSAFTNAKASNPEVVLIGLGTNDIGVGSSAHLPEFEGDYEAMVNVFKGLPSHPKVFAIYPAWFKNDNPGNGYTNARLDAERPMIQQAAATTGACIIDLNRLTKDHPEYYFDAIHPNDAGYKVIARAVCGAVLGGCPPH